ncbi:MAG: DUF47 family protein [Nakamurella sp.]
MGFRHKDRGRVADHAASQRAAGIRRGKGDSVKTSSRRLARTRRVLGDLGGRPRRVVIAHLLAQVACAIEGTQLAIQMCCGEVSTEQARADISTIEHRGDDQRAKLVHALSESVTTPIDREDLYRLSRSVDDVLDNLRDFVRESDLYSPDSLAPMAEPLRMVAAGLTRLKDAVAAVVQNPDGVSELSMEVRKHSNQVRIVYQTRLADLFSGTDVTMDVLKSRELLRRLDVVALRLGEATDALNDGMLKRSM